MLWIKRNLFLAVGGLIAILLLAGGVYYFVSGQQRNHSIEEELEANKSDLNRLQGLNPYPSAQNIEIAKTEAEKLRGAVAQLHRYFSPVPAEKVTGIEFRRYLDRTLAELQAAARNAKTELPNPGYAFSFETQKPKTSFGDGTFPAVPEQIAEVRAIMQVMFDAHVTPLINVRRARVSKDDEISAATTDYLSLKVQTNAVTRTVNSPYEVTFGCLSSELATVLEELASSKHGFIVKAVTVEPAVEALTNAPPGIVRPPGNQPNPPRQPPGGRPLPAAGNSSPGSRSVGDRPVILLNERRLKVTLLIYAIKAVK